MAPALFACGGETAQQGKGETGAAPDAATHDGSEGDAPATSCGVASTTPIGGGGSSCGPESIFQFNGTQAECALPDGGLDCPTLCPENASVAAVSCFFVQSDLYCFYSTCTTGRRPEGLELPAAPGATPTACLLAVLAHLEAASVDAFLHLARELRAHRRAPTCPAPVQKRRAPPARDEVRHARVITKLAQLRGAEVTKVRSRPQRLRPLEAIAVENAVEGCVRETFGAAIAMIQAATARDDDVRAAMVGVGPDETRHAELAWAVARWLDTRLTPDGRARVRHALTRAAEALVKATSHGPDGDVATNLGLPGPRHALALAGELRASLWN